MKIFRRAKTEENERTHQQHTSMLSVRCLSLLLTRKNHLASFVFCFFHRALSMGAGQSALSPAEVENLKVLTSCELFLVVVGVRGAPVAGGFGECR